MIQKLTENLKKSEEYGKKIIDDLTTIGNEILQKRIDIVNIQQKITQARKQQQNVTLLVKKQNQQSSNYDYKMQKLEIRLKQYQRKLALQQEIYDKKQSLRDTLAKKIQALQTDINRKNQQDQLIAQSKKDIQQADIKINKQTITIENLYHQLMNKNKAVRMKEDQLQTRKKANKKKKDNLNYLKNAISACDNKENQCHNLLPSNSEKIMKNLTAMKSQTDQHLTENIKVLLNLFQQFELFSDMSTEIKRELNKNLETNQQIKSQKSNVLKVRDNLISTKCQ